MSASPTRDPSTAVLVLTHNGRQHVDTCLRSLGAMDVFVPGQPGEVSTDSPRHEVWLVDNGSTDGTVEHVKESYPWVRVLASETNRGFSSAYNAAVTACDANWVAFLNDDVHVAPDWLSQLHACRERHAEAVAVASRIMSWDGQRIDFAGADTFFFGHAAQRDEGRFTDGRSFQESPILFGCAGALLVRRSWFLSAGGFDPDYFSFSEDVDLGWRANLLGGPTWFAPEAIAHHKLHGSWSQRPQVRVRRLIEKNALCNVLKNYSEKRMGGLFLLSVALEVLRGWAYSGSLGHAGRPFIAADGLAHFLALRDLVALFPAMLERRGVVQKRRVVSDEDVLPLFGAFASPSLPDHADYREAYVAACAKWGVEEPRGLPSWDVSLADQGLQLGLDVARVCADIVDQSPALLGALDRAPFGEWEVSLAPVQCDRLRRLHEAALTIASQPLGGDTAGAVKHLLHVPVAVQLSRTVSGAVDVPPVQGTSPGATPPVPTVSVVIRTVGRPDHLRRALASVAVQTRPPDQIVVVDDGRCLPEGYLDEIGAHIPTVLVTTAGSEGRSPAAQLGLETASSEFVTFLDDDDELLPDHLQTLLEPVASEGARVTCADVECVQLATDADGSELEVGRSVFVADPDPARLFFENTMPVMAVLMDRRLALQAGGFDTELPYFEDWDLWLRLAERTTFHHCARVTATYYVRPSLGHGAGTVGDHRWTYVSTIFERHRDRIHGSDWARFYQRHLEPERERAADLEEQLRHERAARERADALIREVEGSLTWRLSHRLRRLIGRA